MFATLYIPDFHLQAALRHQPELASRPAALVDGAENRAVLLQVNAPAIAAGVQPGMTPTQGLARCLDLVVKTRAPAQEQTLGDLLLHLAFTLAPLVEATADGVCTIQFTDARHARAGLERVVALFQQSEIAARAAMAPCADTSLLAAHLADPVREVNNSSVFLHPLPIETLAVCA